MVGDGSTDMTQDPILRRNDYIKYLRSLHEGKPIEDIPLENMLEFRLIEDDGQSYWDLGEKITPKSARKMVYVATRLMEFKDSAEYQTGKTRFVVPEEFVDDLEHDRIHYITFTTDGNESKNANKYRLTKVD
jgi:hypothetical protein